VMRRVWGSRNGSDLFRGGEGEVKGAAGSKPRGGPDLAAVLLDDRVAGGKPKAAPSRLGGEVGIEDLLQVLL
jgi:hypothetical protein